MKQNETSFTLDLNKNVYSFYQDFNKCETSPTWLQKFCLLRGSIIEKYQQQS